MILSSGPVPVSTIENAIDQKLRTRKLSRRIGMRVPDLLLSAPVVASTDMLATLPDRLARHFALSLPIELFKLPFTLDDPQILMIWHERTHRDPLHKWMRQLVRQAALRDLLAKNCDAAGGRDMIASKQQNALSG